MGITVINALFCFQISLYMYIFQISKWPKWGFHLFFFIRAPIFKYITLHSIKFLLLPKKNLFFLLKRLACLLFFKRPFSFYAIHFILLFTKRLIFYSFVAKLLIKKLLKYSKFINIYIYIHTQNWFCVLINLTNFY